MISDMHDADSHKRARVERLERGRHAESEAYAHEALVPGLASVVRGEQRAWVACQRGRGEA